MKAKARLALETNRLSKKAKEQKLQIERDGVVGDDNCLFPESSTSSNKRRMDRHVHTQALPENKGKGEKVQTTLNQHWMKKARADACE